MTFQYQLQLAPVFKNFLHGMSFTMRQPVCFALSPIILRSYSEGAFEKLVVGGAWVDSYSQPAVSPLISETESLVVAL